MKNRRQLDFTGIILVLFIAFIWTCTGCGIYTQGRPGAAGVNGTNGTNGTDGQDGADGTNGANGSNGTIITVVQFCPGHGTQYPSSFPEVGLCIDNKLYAVYSANDGFLTEVKPGYYYSRAVGSSCNFEVLLNCEVR